MGLSVHALSGSAWRAQSLPTPLNLGTGAEQIARAAYAQILTNLDAQCDQLENVWASRDQDWAEITNTAYQRTRITRPTNYFLGAQPSLVAGAGARFDKWPAVTVRCDTRKPSEDREQPDQFDVYDISLIVEVLTAAGPFRVDPVDDRTISDAIDRQYQRLSDAVVASIDVDRTLGGNILPIKRPSSMVPSLPFTKKADKGAGQWTIYQAMEITWICTSMSF